MATITINYTNSDDNQIWLKGKGEASEAWNFTVSGIPSGATINSVVLTFTSGNTYNSPGQTQVFWGSSALSANLLWYVSRSSGGGETRTIDLSSRVTGNGSYSLLFRKTANSGGSMSNVCFLGVSVTITYTIPKSTFTLSSTTVEAGSSVTVSIQRSEAVYTHKVTYTFGSRSHSVSNIATSTIYTIPLEWLDQIPNATTGTGTVTVETFNGSSSLGSNSIALTITCPSDIVPTPGTLTAEPIGLLNGYYVQNQSKASLSVSGYSAGLGATISSVVISGGGYSVAANTLTTGYLKTSGDLTFTAVVTDSRNRTANTSVTIVVTPYDSVRITGVVCSRCNADGTLQPVTGTCAKLGCSYSVTTLDGNNAANVRVMWRRPGEVWVEILDWNDVSGYTAVTLVDMLDISDRYEIRFLVEDLFSSAEQIYPIASGKVFMRWEKMNEAVGFGCFPGGTKRVEIAEDWDLYFKNQSLETKLNNVESGLSNVENGLNNIENSVIAAGNVCNLLDNSDFRNPVNQRGRTAYSAAGYTIDRWRIWQGSSVTVNAGSITVTGNMLQYIGGIPAGRTLTFAYGNGEVTHVGNVGYETANGCYFVNVPAGTWTWAALYEGSYTVNTLPKYTPKGYAAELMECLRYYVEIGIVDFYARTRWLFYYDWYRYAIPMRIAPTVTYKNPGTGNSGVMGMYSSGTYVDVAGFNVSSHTYGFRIDGGSNGILTANAAYRGYFVASADL